MVWAKNRTDFSSHAIWDTVRGRSKTLFPEYTDAQTTSSSINDLVSFNNNGFTLGAGYNTPYLNGTGAKDVFWTFRKQPKFFDVVTWTGNGTLNREVANVGYEIGMAVVKATSTSSDWYVGHRSLSVTGPNNGLFLNSTKAYTSGGLGPGLTDIWVNANRAGSLIVSSGGNTNTNGVEYVAYIFAHNAGGFGLTGTDNVISCGTFASDSGGSFSVNLGYEPQWLLIKSTTDATQGWHLYDNMRGMVTQPTAATARLVANTSDAENSNTNDLGPTSTGFNSIGNFRTSQTYIYIAIRRGPMKVPTSATKVFAPITYAGDSASRVITGAGFSSDLVFNLYRQNNAGWSRAVYTEDRLRGLGVNRELLASSTGAEGASGISPGLGYISAFTEDGFNITAGTTSAAFVNLVGTNYVNYLIKRAPSVFDIVCYTGTGSAQALTHNLGAVPELMIVKQRTAGTGPSWFVYSVSTGNNKYLILNDTPAAAIFSGIWNDTTPTSTQFTIGYYTSQSAQTYVAYLFATAAGVSKVGSYTGNGTTQTINCGFTNGARFVLIKRTDSTGDWYVYDTARGMTTLTDPYLLMNTTGAEVATLGSVTSVSTGFALNSAILAAINASGGTYIFLAIA
jgi:hypothetical protein